MTMNVLMLSPGYPAEMPFFTRGLALVGARVIGLGDQPKEMLPPIAREHVAHHLQVRSLWDEAATVREVQRLARQIRIDLGKLVLVDCDICSNRRNRIVVARQKWACDPISHRR